MSPTVAVGVALAVLTALTSIVGFLYKHRGAAESPHVEWRHPVRTSLGLFHSRWYCLGLLVAVGSWGLHVASLSLAPISLVQSVIAGGLVLLTVVADRMFGHRVTRREWIGVALTALGLAFLGATLEGTADSAHASHSGATLALYVALAGVGALAVAALARGAAHEGVLLGAAAGLAWGASDVSIKAQSGRLGDGVAAVLLHPLALVILVASLAGLTISARSLQLGLPVAVIAVTAAAANVVTIAAGPVVFREPLPGNAPALVLRIAAFALVIVAAALTPAPVGEFHAGRRAGDPQAIGTSPAA